MKASDQNGRWRKISLKHAGAPSRLARAPSSNTNTVQDTLDRPLRAEPNPLNEATNDERLVEGGDGTETKGGQPGHREYVRASNGAQHPDPAGRVVRAQ